MLSPRPLRWSALLVLACTGTLAHADWHQFKARCKLDWQRNQAWPQPFIAQDRLATCSPFMAMTANGWRDQCTLSNFHFDPASQQLTEVGRLRVEQIMREHPEAYRDVYVVRASTQDNTDVRLESVQQFVNNLAGGESPAAVRLTTVEPRGFSADDVQVINTKLRASMPDPRLPAPAAAGSATP